MSRSPVRPRAAILAAAPIALLAACGSPATDAVDATNTTTPAGNTVASIRELPEGQRSAVFLRAIRDAGRECQGVTRLAELDVPAGTPPTWQATCQGGAQWLVAIAADGTATVANRADLREGGAAAPAG